LISLIMLIAPPDPVPARGEAGGLEPDNLGRCFCFSCVSAKKFGWLDVMSNV